MGVQTVMNQTEIYKKIVVCSPDLLNVCIVLQARGVLVTFLMLFLI